MSIRNILLLALSLPFASCVAPPLLHTDAAPGADGFRPLRVAVPIREVVHEGQTLDLSKLPKKEIVNLLADKNRSIYVEKVGTGGSLSYWGATPTIKSDKYQITCNNMRCTQFQNPHGPEVLLVGFGVQSKVNAVAKKSGLDLSSIPGLNFAVSRNRTSASIVSRKVGVESPKLSLAEDPKSFDQTEVQALNAYSSALENAITDDGTSITPCVIGVKYASDLTRKANE